MLGDVAWYVPVLIFGARLLDVPAGTMRMILTVQGHRYLAAGLGFFEVMVWAGAVGGLIHYLPAPFALVSYAGGFACGTLLGMVIEDRLALGYRIVRVFNSDVNRRLAQAMRDAGWRATHFAGSGRDGPVEIVEMIVRRRKAPALYEDLRRLAPDAFVTIERCDRPNGGGVARPFIPTPEMPLNRRMWGKLTLVRK
jgi:uncharacterized protein YebE (UPF0316 family)